MTKWQSGLSNITDFTFKQSLNTYERKFTLRSNMVDMFQYEKLINTTKILVKILIFSRLHMSII